MKVKELIKELEKEDQEMSVVNHGYEGGYNDVNGLHKTKIKRDVNSEWYYGNHGDDENGEEVVLI